MLNFKQIATDRHKVNIAVVGCGGTGSILVQELARFNHALIMLGRKGIDLTVYDDDVVTIANYGRQLFSPADLGRHKSEVTIERINRFWGFGWQSVCEKYKGQSHNIVISCTDTIQSRKDINSFSEINFKKHTYSSERNFLAWIDCANETHSGHVFVTDYKNTSYFERFPQMVNAKDKKNKESCSVAESIKKQHIMINKHVSVHAATLLWDILTECKLSYYYITIDIKKNKICRI